MGATGSAVRRAFLITAILAAACGRSHAPGPSAPDAEAGGSASDGGPENGTPPQQSTDGGVQQPPPTQDAGATGGLPVGPDGGSLTLDPAVALPVPPDPSDDPRVCATHLLPPPNFAGDPDRPCTVEDPDGTTRYRYDATGRVVYRAVHTNYGFDATYTSEDDAGVRVETLVVQGRLSTRDVSLLLDGKPVETDHFQAAADGGFVLDGHSTWLYDAKGRQQYVISQLVNKPREVERNVYDPHGRLYFVDHSYYWPGFTELAHHSFTSRSWFATNGRPAHEVHACDIVGGAPCGSVEMRWEPCGNLAYSANQAGSGRGSAFADWSWDPGGRPLSRHDLWTTTQIFESTESYHLDGAGRAVSGTIVMTGPLATEHHEASYGYDAAGRLIERLVDGKPNFHARFDAAGRLIERGSSGNTMHWTYEHCGR